MALTRLAVRDLAIVESVELEPGPGLTVLTGETGAGKSILVGALGLVLGARAGGDLVRAGADRAVVEAEFDRTAGLVQVLEDAGLDHSEDRVSLRRVVGKDGRSRAFVNGSATSALVLRKVATHLVDFAGQHEHRVLLDEAAHRRILDDYAGPQALRALGQCKSTHARVAELVAEQASLQKAIAERERRLDYLRFQLIELDAIAPRVGEIDELDEQITLLSHAEQVAEDLTAVLNGISEGRSNAVDLLVDARRRAAALGRFSESFTDSAARLESVVIELQDLAGELLDTSRRVQSDPRRLAEAEDRRDSLRALARKHRREPDGLLDLRQGLLDEVAGLEAGDERLAELDSLLLQARSDLVKAAARLTRLRNKAARELASAMSPVLADLAMQGGRFAAELIPISGGEGALTVAGGAISVAGAETVRFVLSANPGEPLRPLVQVASGGELARVLLALKGCLRTAARVPTLIFDEVDAGIGGRTADAVAERLVGLSRDCQVLVITHLPRIAVRADEHLAIAKEKVGRRMITRVYKLDHQGRIDELARMIGEGTNPEAAQGLAGRWLKEHQQWSDDRP